MNDQSSAAKERIQTSSQSESDIADDRGSQNAGGPTLAGMPRSTVTILIGLLLVVLGVGLSMTIVLLPIGVPIAVFGGLTLIWGIYDWANR